MRSLLLFIFLLFIFSCSSKNEVPEGILKPGKMQDVFWDYIRADVYTTDYIKKDSSKNAVIENLRLQEKIFKLHKTNRAEFYKSYTWYSNHKEMMTRLMDSMITRKQSIIKKDHPE